MKMLASRADTPKYTRHSIRQTEKAQWRAEHEVSRYLGVVHR